MITLKEYRDLYNEYRDARGFPPVSRQRVHQWIKDGRIEGATKEVGRWYVKDFVLPTEIERPTTYKLKTKT